MSQWAPTPLPACLTVNGGPVFVGRSAELDEFERVWESVVDDNRQVVCVGGEPGVGKTRLAREVAVTVHRHGAAVLWGASHFDLDVAYRPVTAALAAALDAAEPATLAGVLPDSAQHLTGLLPQITRHRPELAATGSGAPDSRSALFDALVDLLVSWAERQPVMVVLEDLHWASSPTMQLLTYLVESTARARLLVLVTHRTTAPDRNDELARTIAGMYRHDGVTRFELSGLDTAATADYLSHGLGVAADDARSSAAVLHDQTGGNPFFLREVWRELAGRGGVEALRSPRYQAPVTVRDTLDRRLAGLHPDHVGVIELAAVVGERVELDTLLLASEYDQATTLVGVDVGVDIGLFTLDTRVPPRYRFQHALARQAVLDRLPPSREAARHAAVARALEQRGGDDAETIARLAHHFQQAHTLGYVDKAVHYLTAAAEAAERGLAHEESAELRTRAAGLATNDPRRRDELLLAAAAARLRAGDFSAARELYLGLTTVGDPDVRLRAAIGYENASWRPGLSGGRSRELLDDALCRYRPAGEHDPLYVRALASTGRALSFTGDTRAAEEYGERALLLARGAGEPELLTHALGATLWRSIRPDMISVLRRRAAELIGRAESLGDDENLGIAAFLGAVFSYMDGDVGMLHRARRELRRATRRGGEVFFRYMVGCETSAHQYMRGEFDAAGRTVATLGEFGREFGDDVAEGSHGLQEFVLRRATGRLDTVRGLIDGTEDIEGHWAPGLLALYVELDLREAAARVLSHLLERLDAYRTSSGSWLGVLAFLVDAACKLGDSAAAETLYPHVAAYRGHNLVFGQFVAVFGSADRELARLGSLLGADDVEAGFEAALAMDRHMGALTHQVDTLTAWSEHVARRGGAGAANRAAVLAGEARDLAERIGYRRMVRRLGGVSVPAPARTLPDGLTEREVEVLRLVAEGLANRDIGERLFISSHTAANHVRSILTKTGSVNRTQAAVYAAHHDLLPETLESRVSASRVSEV